MDPAVEGDSLEEREAVAAAGCPFCAIVRGEAAADVVYADSFCISFLDRRPLFPGHTLVVPRSHYTTLGDLPARFIHPLFAAAQLIAKAVEEAMGAEGSFVAMNNRVSQSVPHLHVHIVPRRRRDGLKGFFWPRRPYSGPEEAEAARVKIESAVRRLVG